ncbi:trimethyllysine dioxygenase [Balamuthia mandrillaris]
MLPRGSPHIHSVTGAAPPRALLHRWAAIGLGRRSSSARSSPSLRSFLTATTKRQHGTAAAAPALARDAEETSRFAAEATRALEFSKALQQQHQGQVHPMTTEESETLSVKRVERGLKSLRVEWSDGVKKDFHYLWLRDNCQCKECYHPITFQRLVDTLSISRDIRPNEVEVQPSGKGVSVHWKEHDGQTHHSLFTNEWLRDIATHALYRDNLSVVEQREHQQRGSIPEVAYKDVMNKRNDDGLRHWLDFIHAYGFAVVRDVPLSVESSKETAERIAHCQATIFGTFWDITSRSFDDVALEHGDTAYTNIGLGAHADGSYSMEPPGLQFFRILEHDGVGGENILVDSFFIAEKLRREKPHSFAYLSNKPVRFHYKDKDNHLTTEEKIFRLDERTGRMVQFRYNNDDRSPVFFEREEEMEEHYDALWDLMQELRNPDNIFEMKLRPGDLLVTNNWRVLHGRKAFSGKRRLLGCYMRMEDFLSKSRLVRSPSSITSEAALPKE